MKTALVMCGVALVFVITGPAITKAAEATNTPLIPPGTVIPGRGPTTRGGPITPAEAADVAKLMDLPAYTPGAGDGDFAIGPMFTPAPEETPRADVPKGKVIKFNMPLAESKFYPPRDLRGTATNRSVTVYIPSQYVPGTPAPFILTHDAQGSRNNQLPTILDNMIADHRLPAMVAVMVMHGGGDGPGSERGLEYDTVSGKYAEFIEAEVLPKVEKDCNVTLTKDPDGRATMGGSSGGAVAFTMAWFHPELYHRVLTYSGTYTANQFPTNPASLHGAWEYHEHFIPESAPKPLRVWLEAGQNDNGSTNTPTAFKNWVVANQRMAAALKAKGYHYQFVYARGAGHVDGRAVAQTLPEALSYIWKGYPIK
jgi:enterochelin esterase-like enzyme